LTKAGCCSSFTERGKRLLFVGTSQKIDYAAVPAVLVANHSAAVLEAVASVAYFTVRINEQAEPVGRTLQNKHYLRKHGSNAYYGQAKESK
jgi:L-ribulose-5-phosphate 4-epimerase